MGRRQRPPAKPSLASSTRSLRVRASTSAIGAPRRCEMEILLLGIYSGIVWLIFFKYKLLPWNFVSQVIVITIPIVGLTMLILFLNIVAPSSHEVRVVNYVVAVNPRVSGLVTEVPIEPNRPIRKAD